MHVATMNARVFNLAEQWVRDVRPAHLVLNGDTFDLGEFSRYPKGTSKIVSAVEEIKEGVRLINGLAKHVGKITMNHGNHEARWEKMIGGEDARKFQGLIGLSFMDQCLAHGLNPDIEWAKESAASPSIEVVRGVHIRHGDKQSGRFGGGVNIATSRLARNQGRSECLGHHHTAQIAYRSSLGHSSFVMAMPTMSLPQDFCTDPNWQYGWSALTVIRRPHMKTIVQPSLIIAEDGVAAWGGKVYQVRG